jgi:hypothetical protein
MDIGIGSFVPKAEGMPIEFSEPAKGGLRKVVPNRSARRLAAFRLLLLSPLLKPTRDPSLRNH